jgi:hypothetical protein
MGSAVKGLLAALVLAPALTPLAAAPALADGRHAVVVFGASGGEKYAGQHGRWAEDLRTSLETRFRFPAERILVLSEGAAAGEQSTRDNIRRALTDLRSRVGTNDLVLVLLVGHGTVDATAAKFNLPGPDMEDSEWAALLRPLPGRLVFINTASGSYPFLRRLSAPNRIVITATDSSVQRFYTVFPERLVEALADPALDRDKNDRVSVWEVFAATAAAVRQHYERRGQLATERPVLDDDGDGRGTEGDAAGPDGALARTTYVDADAVSEFFDPVLTSLIERQRALERDVERLKLRKGSMPPAEWDTAFERLMIELARVSRAIRSRS